MFKVSIVATNARAPGGQFVLHAKALPGQSPHGHTLATVVKATEGLTGRAIERGYVDKKYRCYYMPNPQRIFISDRSVASSVSSNANCAAADSETRAAFVVASLPTLAQSIPGFISAGATPNANPCSGPVVSQSRKKGVKRCGERQEKDRPRLPQPGPHCAWLSIENRGWAGSGTSLPLRPVES
jgi:hypothetical protein